MSYIDKIKNLNVSEDTQVTLSYSDSCDVFVHNDTAVDTAMSETDTISQFSELITTPGFNVTSYFGTPVMDTLREEGFFEDYARDHTFTEFVTEQLFENFYDQEFIESSVEQYDYKRGCYTISLDLNTTAGALLETSYDFSGFRITLDTEVASLTLK